MLKFFSTSRSGTASSSSLSSSTTLEQQEQAALAERRELFSNYVVDITTGQRRDVARKVESLQHHTRNGFRHFIASQIVTAAAIFGYGAFYGPRSLFRPKGSLMRPMPITLTLGIIVYHLTHTLIGISMRLRLVALLNDFEYELKRVKAHHVEPGLAQLAWLQFVDDYIKNQREMDLDTRRMAISSVNVEGAATAASASGFGAVGHS